MKYVGNSCPAWPFGTRPNDNFFKLLEAKKMGQSISPDCNQNNKFKVCTGPGPGSYNIKPSAKLIYHNTPSWKIGNEKRTVRFYIDVL